MEKQFKYPLRKAISVVEKAGYRYAIIGGLALSQWATIRVTEDIDLKVLVADLDYGRIRSIIRSEFPSAARPNALENPFIIAVIIEDVVVDFLLTLPGYEELIVEKAIPREINGQIYWVCTAEDLIIQKMIAGRKKDRLDVESILSAQKGRLDYQYIEKWLIEFDNVLEEKNLLKDYHFILDQIKDLPEKS